MALRVLHLVGSPTSAFFSDLSLVYAADCLDTLDGLRGYEHTVAQVHPDGHWRFAPTLAAVADAPRLGLAEATGLLQEHDLALPQLFCASGMTDHRALLDVAGLPYLGNGPAAMALGLHKARARAVVGAAGVPVPEAEVLRRGATPTLDPPYVVKPVDADNSSGITLVEDPADAPVALEQAFAHGSEVLVERYVPAGREVRCGLVELDGVLTGLPLEEYDVDPVRKPIRTADDKLARNAEDDGLRLVAKDERSWIVDPADPLTARVQRLAELCHEALGCRHYSLFDFRVDPDGQPWFLEAGLYCSFARASVIPTMARAAGIDTPTLFEALARPYAAAATRS